MKSKNTPTDKFNKVEKALSFLLENGDWDKPGVKETIKKLSIKRNKLKEATLTTATINQKDPRKEDAVLNVDPTSQSTLNTLKSLKNTADVTVGGRRLEEQEGKFYSAEEAEAVGKELLKPLLTATRSTQGEIGEEPKVTGEKNKFTIHLVYGHGKGEDTFHFTLEAPIGGEETTSGKLYMNLESGKEEVAPFEVTQANEVKFNPQVNLEERLKDLLVKYTAANTKEPGDIDSFIAERKQAIRESFGQSNLVKVKDTFTIKRASRVPKVTKTTEKEYWNILQGAVDDRGTNRYAQDMAESMILDERVLSFLKSEYPELKTPEDFLERLQWDIEACEPEGEDAYEGDDYDEDQIVPEVSSKLDCVEFDKDGIKKETVKKAVQGRELAEDFDIGHEDSEPHMLKAEIYEIAVASAQLYKMISAYEGKGEVDFPQWWQAKIIQAAESIKCAKEYLEFETVEPQLDATINTLG